MINFLLLFLSIPFFEDMFLKVFTLHLLFCYDNFFGLFFLFTQHSEYIFKIISKNTTSRSSILKTFQIQFSFCLVSLVYYPFKCISCFFFFYTLSLSIFLLLYIFQVFFQNEKNCKFIGTACIRVLFFIHSIVQNFFFNRKTFLNTYKMRGI